MGFSFKEYNSEYNLRFFTPTAEVDLCGHATIAALSVLKFKSNVTVNTKAGQIKTHHDADRYYMTLAIPIFGEMLDGSVIADLLNIPQTSIIGTPQVVSTGLRDIIVQVDSLQHLNDISPNLGEMASFNQKTNTIGFHVFTMETTQSCATAQARNFAPLFDIPEESATGTSTATLVAYLKENNLLPLQDTYVFEQG